MTGPGIEIKLVTGSVHLIYFLDEHDRDRFIREMNIMPTILMWKLLDEEAETI